MQHLSLAPVAVLLALAASLASGCAQSPATELGMLRVEVLFADSLEPAAGALVTVGGGSPFEPPDLFECGPDGIVELPAASAPGRIEATAVRDGAPLRGSSLEQLEDESLAQLLLRPFEAIAFEVVDESGEPCFGAWVASGVRSWVEWDEPGMAESFESWIPLTYEATDREGRAYLSWSGMEAELYKSALESSRDPLVELEYRIESMVTLGGIFAEPRWILMDDAAASAEPVRFVRPDVGSVEVHVTDHSELATRLLSLSTKSEPGQVASWNLEQVRTFEVDGASSHIAHFPIVEQGAPLELVFGSSDRPAGHVVQQFVLEGDHAVRELEFDPEPVRLRGRLLGSAGTALAEREVLVLRDEDGHPGPALPTDTLGVHVASFRTDSKGNFDEDAPWVHTTSSYTGVALVTRDAEGARHFVRLGEWWSGEDLGELTLAPEPIALTGRLVDQAGSPVQGQVRVSTAGLERDDPNAWTASADADGGAVDVRLLPNSWLLDTDSSGRFTLVSDTAAPRLKVVVPPLPEGLAQRDPIEVPVGTVDLELELRIGAELHFGFWGDVEQTKGVLLHVPALADGPDGGTFDCESGRSPQLPTGPLDYRFVLKAMPDVVVGSGSVDLAPGEVHDLGLVELEHELLHYQVRAMRQDPESRATYTDTGIASLEAFRRGPDGLVRICEVPGEAWQATHLFLVERPAEFVVTLESGESQVVELEPGPGDVRFPAD
ncbi:MAG: hypothetical protein P1V81_04115 [Planctomycetota bacterium]|nr:hypothetical protein [Planctomycetota bacterium]